MRVALIQMTSVPNLNENIHNILMGIKEAKEHNADIVLFPENCGFMGTGIQMLANASKEAEHPTLLASIDGAKTFSIHVLLGSIAVYPNDNKNKLYNRSIFINNLGKVIARYDKINMFDAAISDKEKYRESDRYISGSKLVAVDTDIGKIGLTICYDIRFPELYKKLADMDCSIITIPSAFTTKTGKDHWEVLLRARAIESCSWILAPAQIGNHYGNRVTWGHSMIIDPWGNVVKEASDKQKCIIADINIEKSKIVRNIWGKN